MTVPGYTNGTQKTLAGRLTEVFVLRDGRWWHPGWHLDVLIPGA